jgi:hypothetical protein
VAALVQSKSFTGTSGTTLSGSLNSNTTAGNCLVVCVGSYDNSAPPQVSGVTLGGSAGNFASANTAYNSGASLAGAAGWYDPNCAGGQTAVAISFTGGSGTGPATAAWVMEWSGLLTTSVLDAHPAGVANAATSWSSGSTGTLAQGNELAIGIGAFNAGAGLSTPGSPWTELAQLGSMSTVNLAVAYQVVSVTSALTYNGTMSSAGYYGTCIFTLKASAAAPGGAGRLMMVFP